MSPYHFKTAGNIIGGRNSIRSLTENLRLIGAEISSALIVTQPPIRGQDFFTRLLEDLRGKGVSVDIEMDIPPEPTAHNVNDIFSRVQSKSYDVIIGIGGGSVLDTAKVISVLKTNNRGIEELFGTDLVEKPGIPLILIPTTAGTGSEVTPNAIVSVPEKKLKIGIVSRFMLPCMVIIDPLLTLALPKPVTASTGMDAFTHSLESFISNKANPISDMFAMESIRLISSNIVEAYENGASIDARENMLLGALYGGMALTTAGTAAVHALAYPLGGKFNVPHGIANSMLLPHVMRFNKDAIAGRLSMLARPMGMNPKETSGESSSADLVIERISSLVDILGIPRSLSAYGIEERHLDDLSSSALEVKRLLDNNPKQLNFQDIKSIYRGLL